jgi:hypothetical protein
VVHGDVRVKEAAKLNVMKIGAVVVANECMREQKKSIKNTLLSSTHTQDLCGVYHRMYVTFLSELYLLCTTAPARKPVGRVV